MNSTKMENNNKISQPETNKLRPKDNRFFCEAVSRYYSYLNMALKKRKCAVEHRVMSHLMNTGIFQT